MQRLIFPLTMLALASCASTPTEYDYCRGYGVEQGNPEFANCTQYYFQQQTAFSSDRAVCSAEADLTYPPSLYSRPYSYPARFYGGYGFGHYGGFGHTEMVHVGADYQHNAQLDALRARIIEPCMQSRGWNSGVTWQAGRHPVNMRPIKQAKPGLVPPLPWRQ